MATIIIKKRVDLDFLGKDYEDSFLEFKSLSIAEYEKVLDDLNTVGEDNKAAVRLVLSILEKQFLGGSFLGEDVQKEDLKQFDLETMTKCFERFTGQQTDPKASKL